MKKLLYFLLIIFLINSKTSISKEDARPQALKVLWQSMEDFGQAAKLINESIQAKEKLEEFSRLNDMDLLRQIINLDSKKQKVLCELYKLVSEYSLDYRKLYHDLDIDLKKTNKRASATSEYNIKDQSETKNIDGLNILLTQKDRVC